MSSVTQRIKSIKQPHGGYLKPKQFNVFEYQDGIMLNEEENINPALVGLCVDYLTRYIVNRDVNDAFAISIMGARSLENYYKKKGSIDLANQLLASINGLDDQSIIAACKLCGFDVVYRVGLTQYKPVEDINPNYNTIENIRIMVNRSLQFFRDYGPVILDGFTFEGGYSSIIDAGDGDFLTQDTLWDFKVSKTEIKTSHTLQLLIYYLMGVRSIHDEFNSIKKLGIYNPRLNKVYTMEISNISADIIQEVCDYVIGYTGEKKDQI